MSVANLKYLTSEQALADLAYFIEGMNADYSLTSKNKWIVFGGSYPGSLAAWARFKYPHLIHGAMSASGPLLAKKDFKGSCVV
jgi:predicted alpha/beta superfamily hydrolase